VERSKRESPVFIQFSYPLDKSITDSSLLEESFVLLTTDLSLHKSVDERKIPSEVLDSIVDKHSYKDVQQMCSNCTEKMENMFDEKIRILELKLQRQAEVLNTPIVLVQKLKVNHDLLEQLENERQDQQDQQEILMGYNEKLQNEIKGLDSEEFDFSQKLTSYYEYKQKTCTLVKHSKDRNHDAKVSVDSLKTLDVFKFREVEEGFDKGIPMINGFKLGKMLKSTTTWDEINMAFGQCLTCLYQTAKYHNFSSSSCKLLPKGAFSQIESREGEKLNFFYTSDRDTTFAKAMILFVQHAHSLYNLLIRKQAKIQVYKYTINDEKATFADGSVIYNSSIWAKADENWCLALKRMCKFLIILNATVRMDVESEYY
jgi:hypothetical protein